MKQFNLEEYLANPSQEVVTRDGRKVRIICTERLAEYPVVALWIDKDCNGNSFERIATYTIKGQFNADFELDCDLFFAPSKKEGWINIYKTDLNNYEPSKYRTGTIVYNSKEEATAVIVCREDYVTTIKIEWE